MHDSDNSRLCCHFSAHNSFMVSIFILSKCVNALRLGYVTACCIQSKVRLKISLTFHKCTMKPHLAMGLCYHEMSIPIIKTSIYHKSRQPFNSKCWHWISSFEPPQLDYFPATDKFHCGFDYNWLSIQITKKAFEEGKKIIFLSKNNWENRNFT